MRTWILLLFFSPAIFAQKLPSFPWILHPKSIQTLDSLIQQSPRLALQEKDYSRAFLQDHGKLQSRSDSIQFENRVQKLALRFLKHLAYGNRVPQFDFNGIPNKLYDYQIEGKLRQSIDQHSLNVLAQNLCKSSKEVEVLLGSLQALLDTSVHQKSKQKLLSKAINEYRWLSAMKRNHQKLVLVNIPSAQLRSFANGNETLRMKVIVGRPKRPTRTMLSKIDQIVLNPYWHLPKKISVEEYLPKIQKDIHYLKKNHFQVFDLDYQVQNPFKINWKALNASNFPYRFRENPHENSTLGLVKFEFYNPYLIYLHDTSDRYVFDSKRFFRSHGCVRLEKPLELARFILSDQANIIPDISQEKLRKNTKPKNIKMSTIMPMVIWYSLVDFDAAGEVKFFKDVYQLR